MAVPIRNLYYLLCYAWDHLEARDVVDTGALEGENVQDLLARVLRDGVRHLVRRGLDRGYLPAPQDGRRLRGKLLTGETMQRLLLQQGRVACAPDELSIDVPHNRVLKAAMRELAAVATVDPGLRHDLREMCRGLDDVTDVPLAQAAFRQVHLNQNLARYAFLIKIAKLVAGCLLPDQAGTGRNFRSFTGSDSEMGRLFEEFIRNFLIREQRFWNVDAMPLEWDRAQPTEDDHWLPQLRTDVFLTARGQTVIIEAKCVADALVAHHGGSPKLRSAHLYQLLAYLSNTRVPAGDRLTGVLLYAGLGAQRPLDYVLCGHRVLVRNLDLDQPWERIKADLLALSAEFAAA